MSPAAKRMSTEYSNARAAPRASSHHLGFITASSVAQWWKNRAQASTASSSSMLWEANTRSDQAIPSADNSLNSVERMMQHVLMIALVSSPSEPWCVSENLSFHFKHQTSLLCLVKPDTPSEGDDCIDDQHANEDVPTNLLLRNRTPAMPAMLHCQWN